MKKNLFLLFCLMALFSCGDQNDEEIIIRKEGNKVSEKPYLTINNTEIDVKGEGGYRSLKISSNVDWGISDIPDWCKLYTLNRSSDGDSLLPISIGSADSTIVIKIKENNTLEKRMENLKIAGEGIELKLPIIQEGRLSGETLIDPMEKYMIYPGLHFDGDFYLNEGAVFKPLYVQGYSESITISSNPVIAEPLKGDIWSSSIIDYINYIDRDKINKIQAKTIISVSELRAADDFLSEKNMILKYPYLYQNAYARIIIDFKKPLFNLEMSPKVVVDERIKQDMLSKSNTPLCVSSALYGYRKSFVFGVDVDMVETVVQKINDYIEKGDYAMVVSYIYSLSKSYLAISGMSIPISLEDLMKSAQTESLFNSDSQIFPISYQVKKAISNTPL